MSKFSNFKIKWPKSVEKLENVGRLGPPPPKLAAPPKNDLLDPPVTPVNFEHSDGVAQS